METMKSAFQRIIILVKACVELVMSVYKLELLTLITIFCDSTRQLAVTFSIANGKQCCPSPHPPHRSIILIS